MALTSGGDGELALPHYPLPRGKLTFLRRAGAGVTLIVDHQWEGFCTSKGELVHITRGDRGRQQLGEGHPARSGADVLDRVLPSPSAPRCRWPASEICRTSSDIWSAIRSRSRPGMDRKAASCRDQASAEVSCGRGMAEL
jgi:hypothetical protein